MRFGIDISHHQPPSNLNWKAFAGQVHVVIARACYGAELRDKHAVEHVRRARSIGAKVGLYIFYRPTQPVRKQFDLFRAVAEQCGIGAGDIVPALDIEGDPFPAPGHDVSPNWQGPVLELATLLDEWCGAKCMPYITQREFGMLGKPAWILELDRPLWVAHYTAKSAPATPGNRPWTIWQHRVDVFDPNGPGGYNKARPDLDQNRVAGELPLIGATPRIVDQQVESTDEPDDGLEDLIGEDLRALTLAAQQPILDSILDEARKRT